MRSRSAAKLLYLAAMLAVLLFSGQAGRVDAAPAGIKVAVDCDPQTAGIQSACSVTSAVQSFTVDVVLVNQATSPITLAAFDFEVLTDQTKFDPPPMSDPDLDSNPDFKISPAGTWTCAYPGPANDRDLDPAVADSAIYCFDADMGAVVPAGSSIILATLRYNVVARSPAVVNIGLGDVSTAADTLVELGTCGIEVTTAADCSGASVNLTCPSDAD